MPTPTAPIRLHGHPISGHVHRVRLMLSLLGLPFEEMPVDFATREHKSPEFLARNPFGQVPVIEDGALTLAADTGLVWKSADVMFKYYKAKYGITSFDAYVKVGEKINFNGMAVFTYNIYDIPDEGYQLAVFTDEFFDDKLGSFDTAHKNAGRVLWGIDWSDVAINVLRTNSAMRKTNVADRLYEAVISPVMTHTKLFSKTIEVQVGDTNRHALIENFSDACPSLTVAGCDLN